MNKCEHGEKITHFCVTDNCQHKDGAACPLCLKKYHNHITHTTHLTEPQMQNLIKKFALDNTVKPKCRTLQELIYNYFNQVKGEISASLDTVCKNIINQIGYPYLFSIHGISTYKRLKNKEYRKITQREFRAFYEVANQVEDSDLIRQENKIYLQEIKLTNEAITKLQDVVRSYGQCVRRYHEDFTHQRSEQYKISEMIKSIGQQQRKGHRKNTESSLSDSKEMQVLGNSKQEVRRYQSKAIQRNDIMTKQTPSMHNEKNRDVSLDRRVVKQHKFSNIQKIVQKTKQSQEDSETNLGNRKIQNLKVQLNNKEMQINEKKKQLMNIMKPNLTDKQTDIKASTYQTPTLKIKSIQTASVNKQASGSTRLKSFNESVESEQILVIEEYDSEEQVSNFAFSKLPIEQNVKKAEQKHQVKKRMIVIPNLLNLKGINNNNKIDALDSPLYKKRMQNNIEQSKNKQQAMDKFSVKSGELQQKQVCRQMLEIKENEQKSLALLLKSLTLSAQQAIVYLQSSLKYADNNLSAAQYLSYLYLQTHRPKQCLTLCNKLIDKMQSTHQSQLISININNNKAAALNTIGRYSQAIMILQKCLKHKETDTLYKNLGDSYFSIGMLEKAIYNYQKSLKVNGSYDEAHYNLAVCLYMQQNYQQSKLQIKKALDLNHKEPIYIQLQTFIDGKIKLV